jgi:hypothetical protein
MVLRGTRVLASIVPLPATIPHSIGPERLSNPLVGLAYELQALGRTVCI